MRGKVVLISKVSRGNYMVHGIGLYARRQDGSLESARRLPRAGVPPVDVRVHLHR
jgi:hypothetical protein